MTRKTKIILSLTAGALLVGVGVGLWTWQARGPLLKEIAKDLKAGAMSRHAANPFEHFIELRYGSMTNPANRQAAFLGYFDPAHMEGMAKLVGYMKPHEREKNIAASAAWISHYRETMTPDEKQSLAAWVDSPEGRAQLQRASVLYRTRDVNYRASTEPVIRELMTTLAGLQDAAPK